MKYLMINVVCGVLSTGRICTDLAIELESKGYDVKIAYGREEVPMESQKYAVRIGNNIDIGLHLLKTRLFDGSGFGSKRATKKFIKWVEWWNPDVIHLHNLHGYYINIEVLFEYLRSLNGSKKIIWTLHDCWPFTGHCNHFTAAKCDRWKSCCYRCPQKKEYPGSILLDKSKKNWELKKRLCSGIANMSLVTPSKWLANLVRLSFLGEYPIEVQHNTVNNDIFKPTKSNFRKQYGLEEKNIVLGVASSWNERKGLYDLLEISTLLDEKYVVVIVGLNERQIKIIARKYANILAIERTNNVRELAEIYSAADVFVNPSREETFSMTTLEALSCGTYAIVYKNTACEEVVNEHGIEAINSGINSLLGEIKRVCNMR